MNNFVSNPNLATTVNDLIEKTLHFSENINNSMVSLKKVYTQTTLKVGDECDVTLTFINTYDVPIENIVLHLNIPDIAEIVNNDDSLSIDKLSFPKISPGQTVEITYKIIINSMPPKNPVSCNPYVELEIIDANGTPSTKTIKGDVTPIVII